MNTIRNIQNSDELKQHASLFCAQTQKGMLPTLILIERVNASSV